MKLYFRETPWDLYVGVGYAVAVTAILVVLRSGNFIALLLIVFVPGYVLMAALFPSNNGIGWTERLALSVVLSIVIVALLGWAFDFTPWGFRFLPIVVTIALFTGGVAMVATVRRTRLPPDERLAATLTLAMPAWWDKSLLNKGLIIALTSSVIFVTATLAYVALNPLPGERFTEFFILGPSGNASDYPNNLTVNETGSIILGIVNREAAVVSYTVRIDLVGLRIGYNNTAGFNETVEVNLTTWSTFNVTLANGQNWTRPYSFRINDTGLWKIEFLLLKDHDLSSAYRELHLYLRVN